MLLIIVPIVNVKEVSEAILSQVVSESLSKNLYQLIHAILLHVALIRIVEK